MTPEHYRWLCYYTVSRRATREAGRGEVSVLTCRGAESGCNLRDSQDGVSFLLGWTLQNVGFPFGFKRKPTQKRPEPRKTPAPSGFWDFGPQALGDSDSPRGTREVWRLAAISPREGHSTGVKECPSWHEHKRLWEGNYLEDQFPF